MTITLTGKRRGLDRAPVSVELTREARRNVLAVPVTALLAQRGGAYAVELAGGGLVSVETGVFADGWVEVSGGGLREGARVTVPSA